MVNPLKLVFFPAIRSCNELERKNIILQTKLDELENELFEKMKISPKLPQRQGNYSRSMKRLKVNMKPKQEQCTGKRL